ncbi:uncharacterized protein LOC124915037 [Impatiens glandulifera]|uniref:uncharacterized protein LOC124915037 n=1 Tax=Impatiens glandulifera TaxID=253017 RepID=UPI001FB0682A|nr:uncharacterized protein LOC124915037 [Impatiens glandulifera]
MLVMASSRKLPWEENEWEYINDDGFVYKRQKRFPDPTTSTIAPTLPDPAAEEKNRKETKRRALINLREKYRKEISHWDILSNTLKAMQEKFLNQSQLSSHLTDSSLPVLTPRHANNHERKLDELLIQTESEEALMEDISNLCDVAEAICRSEEERNMQSLVNLPIWVSPQELMKSLCEE